MGVQTQFLPAVGTPSHTFYCPASLFPWGPLFGVFFGALMSEVIPVFEIGIMIGFALWHVFWATQFLRDPWIADIISARMDLRILPGFYTRNPISEKAWAYG